MISMDKQNQVSAQHSNFEHVTVLLAHLRLQWLLQHFPTRLVWAVYVCINGFVTIGLLALLALLTGSPFVFPSLGPTAYLFFFSPLAEASSPRNTIVGHAIGLICGYAAFALTAAYAPPFAIQAGVHGARVLAAALSLSATGAFMALLRVAICKGESTDAIPLSLDHVRDPNAAKKAVRLSSVHNVENVNALAPGERLTFDRSGLTVVYGDNGAEKSGYIRILKRVCRARSPKDEKIEPNVYALTPGPQRACIKFCVEDQHQEAQWQNGTVSHPILSSVSVFDSRTANVHVDETNNVAYTPLPMRLLEELAQVCKTLRDRLAAEVTTIQQLTPASLSAPKCTSTTRVGKLISQLSDKTKVADVESLAMVSTQERAHCDSLQRDLASNPAAAARTLEVVRARIRTAVNTFQKLRYALNPAPLADLDLKYVQLRTAQEAATLAADALFTGEPLAHVGVGNVAIVVGECSPLFQSGSLPKIGLSCD